MKPDIIRLKPERIQRLAKLFGQAQTIASKVMGVVDWIQVVAEVLKEIFGKPTNDDSNQ